MVSTIFSHMCAWQYLFLYRYPFTQSGFILYSLHMLSIFVVDCGTDERLTATGGFRYLCSGCRICCVPCRALSRDGELLGTIASSPLCKFYAAGECGKGLESLAVNYSSILGNIFTLDAGLTLELGDFWVLASVITTPCLSQR